MAQGEALSRSEATDPPLHLSIPRPDGPVPGRPEVSVRRRSGGAARGPSPGRRARIPMLELRGLGGRAVGDDLALATDRLYAVRLGPRGGIGDIGDRPRLCPGINRAPVQRRSGIVE